ncbi:MAG TPA: hypothetical protein HPQ00_13735, partial [Magnetococcales bacterium]|nr:hypothetical protein [Magnetococcales bacterium]
TAKAFGLGVVSLGRTILGHTVATNGITRDVEHQTLELLVRHLDFCLHSRTQQSLDVSRMN